MNYTITIPEIARLSLARELQCAAAYNAGDAGPAVNRAVANVAWVNGETTIAALPVGKLAAWARLLNAYVDPYRRKRPKDEEIDVSIEHGQAKFRHGGSFLAIRLYDMAPAEGRMHKRTPLGSLGATIRIVADGANGGAFKVELPDGAESGLKELRKQAATARKSFAHAKRVRTARETEKRALERLSDAARAIVADKATVAGGIEAAYVFACDCRDALRVWRRSIATPEACPPWLPESYTPTAQELEDCERFGAGFMPDTAPRVVHAALVASLAEARAVRAAYKPRVSRFAAYNRVMRGRRNAPLLKHERLDQAVAVALSRIQTCLSTQYQRRLVSIGLPRTIICGPLYIEDIQAFSRARLAVRRWPVFKAELAACYTEARATRKELTA